jgi:drug/metabolite transporter (DMT)-like permease
MLSLTFGLVAAVCWGLHDFIIRILKQPKGIYASIAAVLFFGCLLQSPVALLNADFSQISNVALSVSVASGSFFALAGISLYKAFIIGPIKLVAPIVGAYPVFSLIFSSLNGNPPTSIQVGAVIIIVICAGYVAASKEEKEGALADKKSAIFWAILSSFGFASSFALGQYASNLSDQYALLLPNRISALIALILIAKYLNQPVIPDLSEWRIFALMAFLDAVAQGFVISSGKLEFPVYASISASLFGLVTILLAAFFLREKIYFKQWIAIFFVFFGLTVLSS